MRASTQLTGYADYVSVVSPREFRSAVAWISVELTVYSPLVSAPVASPGVTQKILLLSSHCTRICVFYAIPSTRTC